MEGHEQDAAPYEGTTDPQPETQPQTDPAAPDGTTEQDDQQGTPEPQGQGGKEQFYQSRYQKVAEVLRQHGIDPKELAEGNAEPGSLEAALSDLNYPQQGQQGQQGQQPQPEQPEQGGEEIDFDPYDPVQMKQYLDQHFGKIRGNLSHVVKDVITEVRQQEQMQLEAKQQMQDFNEWASENKVPQDAINRAVKTYVADFGNSNAPAPAVMKAIKFYIRDMGYADGQSKVSEAAVKDAIEKARGLDAVENPSPGGAPAPDSQKKSWQDELRDEIAPPTSGPQLE